MEQRMIDAASDALKRKALGDHLGWLDVENVTAWFSNGSEGVEFSMTYRSGWQPLFLTPPHDGCAAVALVWQQVVSPFPLFEHYDKALPWEPLYTAR